MSKSKSSKTPPTKQSKADLDARKDQQAREVNSKRQALCAEIKVLATLVAAQLNKLATNISTGSEVAANTYETAKDNLTTLRTNVNRLALHLPRKANADAKPAKAQRSKAAQQGTVDDDGKAGSDKFDEGDVEDADLPEDDGPEGDDDFAEDV